MEDFAKQTTIVANVPKSVLAPCYGNKPRPLAESRCPTFLMLVLFLGETLNFPPVDCHDTVTFGPRI